MKEYPFELPVQIQKFWVEKATKGKDEKEEREESHYIEGFAAVEGEDDSNPPMYLTKEALKEADESLDIRNKIILQHESWKTDSLVGKIVEHKFIDEKPAKIWFKGLISQTAPLVWQKIKEGVLDGVSIGGSILSIEQTFDEKLKIWVTKILKFAFRELSLVVLPANTGAKITDWSITKSLTKALENYERGGDNKMEENEKTEENKEENMEEEKEEKKENKEEQAENKEENTEEEKKEGDQEGSGEEDAENKEKDIEKAAEQKKKVDMKALAEKLNQLISAIQSIVSSLSKEVEDVKKSENTEENNNEEIENEIKEIKKSLLTKESITNIVTEVLSNIPDIKKTRLVASGSDDEEEILKAFHALPAGERLRTKLELQLKTKK